MSILLCIDGSHGALVRRNMWIHKYRDDMVPTVLCIIFSIIKHAFLSLEFKSFSLPFCFFFFVFVSLCLCVFHLFFFVCFFRFSSLIFFYLCFFFFSPPSLSSFSVFISFRFFFCLSLSVYFFPSPLSHYFFPLRNRRMISVIFSNLKTLRIYMMDVVCWTLIILKTTGS